jgi:hypothetical protein
MSSLKRSLFSLILLFSVACSQNTDKKIPVTSTLFKQLDPKKTQLKFTNILAEDENFNLFSWLYIYNGAGLATGDINNDGLADVYMVANVGSNKLFLNEGNFKFTDITQQSKMSANTGYKTGVTMVDINGDGWLDIYLCRDVFQDPKQRRNLVFINNKDLTFSEKGVELGLVDQSYSTLALFLDIDQDNDLDVYVINHPPSFENATSVKSNRSSHIFNNEIGNILFENVEGKFIDISEKAGVNFSGFGLSGIANDFNNDGFTDIYVANDFIEPDILYINNGDKTFTNASKDYFSHMSHNSMGCDLSDINKDGLLDLVVTDMLAESNVRQKVFDTNMKINSYERLVAKDYGKQMMRNTLFIGNENGLFSEVGQLAGMEKSDWSWSPLFADVNLDGNVDLFISNGITRDMGDIDFINFRTDSLQKAQKKGIQAWTNKTALAWLKMIPSTPIANHLYLNSGNLTFNNKSMSLGLEEKTFSQGAVFTDLDNDGDQDLIVSNQGKPTSVYENTNQENKSLKITLKGPKGNTKGLGAKVKIFVNGSPSIQLVTANRGFLSSPNSALHFGLKAADKLDSIIVYWSDGLIQIEKENLISQNLPLIHDIEKKYKPKEKSNQLNPLRIDLQQLTFSHKENQFDDFKRQPLLINTNSKEGPALTINQAKTSVFIGGAFDQPSEIFQNNEMQSLINSENYEDVDAQFVDLDNDGVEELYVVSGGTRYDGRNILYNDRVYKKEQGKFRLSSEIPTNTSGSVVAVADFNNDNFTDLFIGSSHVPGKYPHSPYSYFLRNNNGSLILHDSMELGNIRDARFLDINKDGLQDLIIVGEWMPVTILINKGDGNFSNETSSFGLDKTNGLWQSLYILEDQQGISLAVGNYGLNTPYNVSPTEPLTSYTLDFDSNDSPESIITQYLEGEEWPLHRKETITSILPSLKKNYLTNKSYSLAKIVELFGEEKIRKSQKHYVYELRSGFFRLTNSNKFDFTPFDISAQMSPINDFEFIDINSDDINDLIFSAGMDYTEVEQGPMVALSLGAIILDKRNNYDNPAINLIQGKAIKKIGIFNNQEKLILTAENNGPLKVYNITW